MARSARFGVVGLVVVLLAILVISPYIKRLVKEGFEEKSPAVVASAKAADDIKGLTSDIDSLNKVLQDTTLDSSTRDKLTNQKVDKQALVTKLILKM